MKKRYDNKERIGVYKVAIIVEQELNWIFREQPIVDVGIDALVEFGEDGIPKGKFIAFQIKSGKHNFHKSELGYNYYLSNTHYYYWTELDMQVLLLGYIPEDDLVYWEHVTKKNIRKTKTRWKITLPFENVFNKSTSTRIKSLLYQNENDSKDLDTNQDRSFLKRLSHVGKITYATDSLFMITGIIDKFGANIRDVNARMNSVMKTGTPMEKVMVIGILNESLDSIFQIVASRLMTEIQIFSSMFANGLIGQKERLRILYASEAKEDLDEYSKTLENLRSAINSFNTAIEGIKKMEYSINEFLKMDDNVFEQCQNSAEFSLKSITAVLREIKTGRKLLLELLETAKDLKD